MTALWVAFALVAIGGCRGEMYDQDRLEPYEASSFFRDGQSSRPLVAGTVARGRLRADKHFFEGKVGGKLVETFPTPIDRATVDRGQARYMIYCSPCHGSVGDGRGMIVERGFPAPPSFHTQELREKPVGHYYDAITNGFGAMYPYASRIEPKDRWAIIAYVRALQLSQNAELDELPPTLRAKAREEAR